MLNCEHLSEHTACVADRKVGRLVNIQKEILRMIDPDLWLRHQLGSNSGMDRELSRHICPYRYL